MRKLRNTVSDVLIAVAVASVGLVLLHSNAPELTRGTGFSLRGIETTGKVVDCVRMPRVDQLYDQFVRVVEFAAANGYTYFITGESSSTSCVDEAHFQRPISVRYNNADPYDARIGTTWDLLLRPMIFSVLGVGALVLAFLGARQSILDLRMSFPQKRESRR
jgi:hypothetical protein